MAASVWGLERLVEVDVADLGADRARQRGDVELDGRLGGSRHGFLGFGLTLMRVG